MCICTKYKMGFKKFYKVSDKMKIEYESLRSELTDEEVTILKLLEKCNLSTKEVSSKIGAREEVVKQKYSNIRKKLMKRIALLYQNNSTDYR